MKDSMPGPLRDSAAVTEGIPQAGRPALIIQTTGHLWEKTRTASF